MDYEGGYERAYAEKQRKSDLRGAQGDYESKLKAKRLQKNNLDASKGATPSTSFSGSGAATGAAKAAAGGGSAADVAAGGLMASGNPYAMAAGVGLSMMSASAKRKREAKNQAETNRVTAENTRRNNTMRALQQAQNAAQYLG